ncbi:MAG TPA: hypothetical protein ENO29_03265 [Candidatus Aminicenantes bacterium]|nr:MAG: hypothetical protein C0168_05015 [Candidatus Aminicenantes bacterium]HEK85360.1 hypothetical protein [Candidatus Aminicenantes bacterium]
MTEIPVFNQLPLKETKKSKRVRILIFCLEIVFVGGLLATWLLSRAIRQNKSLWVLFFYCFPSEFLISILPHEPVLLYFSKFYSPATVALVSIVGTVLAEALDYSAIFIIKEHRFISRARKSAWGEKFIRLFGKAPTAALWLAAFFPAVPFYPFRFLVVLSDYPLWKYLLVIFTARLPKFYLLALVGQILKIPDLWIIAFFVILLFSAYLPAVRFHKKKKIKKASLAARSVEAGSER